VIVVLSPHPDDETLTFGPWITEAVSRGDRVVLVALTDGRSTGAIGTVSTRLGRTLTRDEIAAARLRELHQAATALGIAPSDVYRARLDDDAGPGGTRITVAEAGTVVAAFAARFPDATFASMSWIAEQHPDHLDAGHALADAASTGVVRHAVFAESRLWWALSGPTTVDVLATTAADRRRLDGAVAAYELWDPAHQRYAVGWNSVHGQFTSLLADPRTRLHGPDPTPAHPTPRDHAHLS
jgi:LmbE family N-acetylglucosaminyl deacetylase